MTWKGIWTKALVTFAGAVLAWSTAWASAENILYQFQGTPDGSQPWSGLIADRSGNLYGTTTAGGAYGYGTVFQLTPPSRTSPAWTETVLYSFQNGNDGAQPFASLVFDPAGNLYGTTTGGGNQDACFECGVVFKLAPPSSRGGTWTETVLYTFGATTADAAVPYGGLILDEEGNLYGTTRAGGDSFEGTVFELMPPDHPSGGWTERVLFSFTGGNDGGLPMSSLARKGGVLYGTTEGGGAQGYGTVFRLSRAGGHGSWSEDVLYNFTGGSDGGLPLGGLTFDRAGNLFGTTAAAGDAAGCGGIGCGTVFELISPRTSGGRWIESTLYVFTGGADGGSPSDTLTIDENGILYGTAALGGNINANCNAFGSECGTVFELKAPASARGMWAESTLYAFNGAPDGYYPTGSVFLYHGSLYGTASSGGDAIGDGIVFQVTP